MPYSVSIPRTLRSATCARYPGDSGSAHRDMGDAILVEHRAVADEAEPPVPTLEVGLGIEHDRFVAHQLDRPAHQLGGQARAPRRLGRHHPADAADTARFADDADAGNELA